MSLSEHIIEVDESTFSEEVLQRSYDVPVVVDFWAPWCAPCRTLGPLLERAAIEANGAFRLAKLNVDENPNLAIRFGVRGIPAVKAFRQGQVVSEFVGAQPDTVVRKFLLRVAPTEVDAALERALSLLGTRHWAEAEAEFRRLLESEDADAAASLGLLKALLMQGKGDSARQVLATFPRGVEVAEAEKLRPLADLLAEAAEAGTEVGADPLEAQVHQSGRLIERGNLEAALDGLLDVLRADKGYRRGAVRQAVLGVFALLGDDDPTTRAYREELASILF